MKNLPKEKRDQLIMIAVGALAIIIAMYYGVIRIQSKSLDELVKKHAEEDRRVTNGQRLAGSVTELQQMLGTAQGKLKTIESGMASGDMYSWIILTMNSFKENGGYKIEIPQFSREVPSDIGLLAKFPYRAAIFHVRGTAYFHDFGRFVSDFENTFPYMRIQNIDLEPGSSSFGNNIKSDDQEKLSFKMEIVTLVNPNSH